MAGRARFVDATRVCLLLAALLLGLAALALAVGSVSISAPEVLRRLGRAACGLRGNDAVDRILWTVRLPRILLAVAVGGTMGLAGLAAQTLFRNPLASPYVMGVSNGAAVGAVFGMLLAGPGLAYSAVPVLSVLSGLGVTALVFRLARRGGNFGSSLLLSGIAVSAFCSALTAGALYVAGERLQSLVFWLMGGLWQAAWRDVAVMLPVGAACCLLLSRLAPAMNVVWLGDRTAGDLGVNVRRLQQQLVWIVAVATAVAVSVTGVIGFVGLIVPHGLRLALGADHRKLVPASALGGAVLLLAADTLARVAVPPAEIPVGILTALVGAPLFLWLLQRRLAGRDPA